MWIYFWLKKFSKICMCVRCKCVKNHKRMRQALAVKQKRRGQASNQRTDSWQLTTGSPAERKNRRINETKTRLDINFMANKKQTKKSVEIVVQKLLKIRRHRRQHVATAHTWSQKIDKENQRHKSQCAIEIILKNMQNMWRQQSKQRLQAARTVNKFVEPVPAATFAKH